MMNNELTILLEWFKANGIDDVFEDNIYIENKNPIINFNENKNLNNVLTTIAKQQNNLKNNNIFTNEITNIQNLVDSLSDIEKIINIINSLEIFDNKRKLANNTIIFDRKIDAKILIINDFPNESDDLNNKIFSGEAETKLENMFKSINIEKSQYCLLNLFFWRLAGGRTPLKEEFELCKPFVEKIISLIKPKMIVFTGNYGVSTLLEENKTVVNTRGKFFNYSNKYLFDNILATSLYSPNFLIKNPDKRKDAFEDLKAIREKLNEDNN